MTLPSFGSAPGHQLHLAAELGHVPQRACDLVGERHVRRRHPRSRVLMNWKCKWPVTPGRFRAVATVSVQRGLRARIRFRTRSQALTAKTRNAISALKKTAADRSCSAPVATIKKVRPIR